MLVSIETVSSCWVTNMNSVLYVVSVAFEHELWQKKCKETVRKATRKFQEHLAKTVKTDNKRLFKFIRNRKPASEALVPLDEEGVTGVLKG